MSGYLLNIELIKFFYWLQKFRRILANEPPMPRTLSKEGQDLIVRLLSKDPHTRLGGGEAGFEEIKKHAMFQVSSQVNNK